MKDKKFSSARGKKKNPLKTKYLLRYKRMSNLSKIKFEYSRNSSSINSFVKQVFKGHNIHLDIGRVFYKSSPFVCQLICWNVRRKSLLGFFPLNIEIFFASYLKQHELMQSASHSSIFCCGEGKPIKNNVKTILNSNNHF